MLAAFALLAIIALPATGEESRAPALATTSVAAGSISWTPQVAFDRLVLTVEGGGYTITREFTGQPFFVPVDPEGYQLPDGTYNWELTAAGSAARGGQPGDGPDGRATRSQAVSDGRVESGSFTIANGAIVDPVSRVSSAEAADAGDSDADR